MPSARTKSTAMAGDRRTAPGSRSLPSPSTGTPVRRSTTALVPRAKVYSSYRLIMVRKLFAAHTASKKACSGPPSSVTERPAFMRRSAQLSAMFLAMPAVSFRQRTCRMPLNTV